MTTLLARIRWLRGFPDQAAAAAREAIEAALKTRHGLSLGYALCMAGCPVALWTGDLPEAKRCTGLLREHAARNGLYSSWGECYEHVVRLREGTDQQALMAAYIEPRVDVSTIAHMTELSFDAVSADRPADQELSDALWSYPEVLRVDAELMLHAGSPELAKKAEAKLLQSLDLRKRRRCCRSNFEPRPASRGFGAGPNARQKPEPCCRPAVTNSLKALRPAI
jgi:hypothetical protein